MDPKAFLNFIVEQYVVIFGTTIALFLTTSMVLVIRSIGKKDDEKNVAAVDIGAIEGAMKRVLSTQPVSIVAGSSAASSSTPVIVADGDGTADPAALASLQQALNERDQRIEQLTADLNAAMNAPAGEDDAATVALKDENSAFKAKLEELQGRLAEYEIIEDDIADLSMFKDENARLKSEVAKLKAELAQGGGVATMPATAAPAIATESASKMNFEKSEKFELDFNDDVMKEFAAAVQVQRAPPPATATEVPAPQSATTLNSQDAIDAMLAGAVHSAPASPLDSQAAIDAMLADTVAVSAPPEEPSAMATDSEDPLGGTPDADKLLTEVEAIDTAPAENAGDALEDSLDTDKLLAEVDSLKGSAPGAKPATSALEDDLFNQFNKAQGS